MNGSIHEFFRVGMVHWMSFPPSAYSQLETIREVARDPFFTYIEVCHGLSERERREARAVLEQAHMGVGFGAHPVQLGQGLNPNDVDEAGRQAAERALLQTVDEARSLNAEGIVFLAGKWRQETRELAFEQLVKTTRSVCEYAASFGMTVEMELFDYDVDKAVLMGPAPYAARFAERMSELVGNFGLLVDLSHLPLTRESAAFAVHTLRPYLTHFHIGNAVIESGRAGFGDNHPRFGFPGGENDVAQLRDFFCVLKAEGFLRREAPIALSIEIKPYQDEDARLVIAGAKRVIQRAWALAE